MKAIDYEKESASRSNWLDITGGTAKDSLTVLDYFAGEAIKVYLTATMGQMVVMDNVAENAYDIAEAMLKERAKRFTPANVVTGITGRSYG